MLYDLAISSIVTLIAIAPMAFAAWYDGRLETQPETRRSTEPDSAAAAPRGLRAHAPYTRGVDRLSRRDSLILLAILGTGVFLAGLELMITAVALPAIVTDLADWTRLREASWIINGYLLVYVVTMPVAGRLADLYGARRLFLWALVIFTLGSLLAGAAPTLELLIVARLVQAVGGGALVPVATSAASHLFTGASRPRALGVVGALTFLGMAAGPVLGAAILGALHPEAALSRLGFEPQLGRRRAARPGLALGVLRQRARRPRRARRRLGRQQRLGDAAPRRAGWTSPGPILFSAFLVGALGALTLLGSQADAGRRSRPGDDLARPGGRGGGRRPGHDRARPPCARPVPGPAAVPVGVVLVRGPGLAAHRVRLRDRDRGRRGVRGPGAVRRTGRAAARAGRPRGRDGRRRAAVRVRGADPVAASW